MFSVPLAKVLIAIGPGIAGPFDKKIHTGHDLIVALDDYGALLPAPQSTSSEPTLLKIILGATVLVWSR